MTVNNQESGQDTADTQEDDRKARAKAEARRVWIMRGLITPILGMLAVTCVALGLLNATVWKPSREITATTSVNGVQYITTDPGVLPLVDQQATLTVRSTSSDEICVALGSGKDINGWVAGAAYARVTGLHDWHTLSSDQVIAKDDAKTDDQSAVAFKDSDMWTQVTCGKATVSVKTDVEPGASTMALIDLGKSGSADVSLHWVRQTLPDFAIPFYFAGGLLAVMAVLTASLFAMPPHKRRKRVVASAAAKAEEVAISEAIAGSWAAIRPRSASSKSRHSRHRHRTHRDTETSVETTGSQPTIVDPSARNLVAEAALAAEETTVIAPIGGGLPQTDDHAQSTATISDVSTDETAAESADDSTASDTSADDSAGNEAATSVITPEELQAYFARFAQESTDSSTDSADDTDDTATDDSAHDDKEAK